MAMSSFITPERSAFALTLPKASRRDRCRSFDSRDSAYKQYPSGRHRRLGGRKILVNAADNGGGHSCSQGASLGGAGDTNRTAGDIRVNLHRKTFFSAMPPAQMTLSTGTPYSSMRSMIARAPNAVASISAR